MHRKSDIVRDPTDKLTIAVFSDMTGGSSGGPWVGNNPSGKLGYVFGLNSYKLTNDSSRMYSPYFDFVMEALNKMRLERKMLGRFTKDPALPGADLPWKLRFELGRAS